MWSRSELKERAKEVLRKTYWNAFGVSLVIALVGGNHGGGGGGNSHAGNSNFSYNYNLSNGINNYNLPSSSYHFNILSGNFLNWAFAATTVIMFIALLCALRIFIGYSLEVGGRKFFIKSAEHKNNRSCFRFGFDGQNYGGIIKTMFVMNVFLILWTLLLIIPGIIKSYAYRMVPYILADNPNIGVMRAIELSNEMTRGHKFDMFVLDLSFIGWYLLGALALGIGVLFVMPYENATNAELYLVLREDAIKNNLCSNEDLLLNQPSAEENAGPWYE